MWKTPWASTEAVSPTRDLPQNMKEWAPWLNPPRVPRFRTPRPWCLDGRYRAAVAPLVDYLSEAALNRDRVHVEVEWLIHLTSQSVLPGAGPLSDEQVGKLRAIVTGFNAASVNELAEIEAVTVHDVKAVEYYIGRRLPEIGIENLTAMVHFGCTSEDINNLSYAVGIKGAVEDVWLPNAKALVEQIQAMAEANREVPMLSRTHGQPATPTTLGKELAVIAHRLNRQLERIAKTHYLGKINGATARTLRTSPPCPVLTGKQSRSRSWRAWDSPGTP